MASEMINIPEHITSLVSYSIAMFTSKGDSVAYKALIDAIMSLRTLPHGQKLFKSKEDKRLHQCMVIIAQANAALTHLNNFEEQDHDELDDDEYGARLISLEGRYTRLYVQAAMHHGFLLTKYFSLIKGTTLENLYLSNTQLNMLASDATPKLAPPQTDIEQPSDEVTLAERPIM